MDLLHTLSELALRHLSAQRFAALRRHYLAVQRHLTPMTRRIYGTFDTAALRTHLEERLGTEFEVLMVHSSLNHMHCAYTGNALELVRMLIEFCGPHRTLAMPAFFFGDPKIGDVQATFRQDPTFDLRRTPSQMGLATEIFRRTKGVVQSRHPVYRIAALGPRAAALTAGHEHAASAAGRGSPFAYMAAHDTLILGIGKSFQVMTQVHHVEEMMGDAFPVPRRPLGAAAAPIVTVVEAEHRIPVTLRGGGLAWRFNIDKLPDLLMPGDLDLWHFHQVPFFAARARRITDRLVDAARRGKTLYDPP